MPENTQPNLLDLFKKMLDDHLGKAEFTAAFSKVADSIQELRSTNEAEFAAIQTTVDLLAKKLAEDNTNDLSTFKAEAKTLLGSEIAAALASVNDKLTAVDERVSQLKDGEMGLQGEQGPQGPAGSADSAEDVRNKLELLEGDERLKIEAIKDLREELDKLKKSISSSSSGTSFVISRGAVKMYDLSPSLNGILKTFALPAFWRVISVHTSSFPNILRPDVDYTTDGALMKITFTNEIDASTTLAAGQSVIIVYGEA